MNALSATKASQAWLLLLILAFTAALPIMSHSLPNFTVLEKMPSVVNRQLVYQCISLLGTFVFLIILNRTRPDQFWQFFRMGKLKAKIQAVPLVGIKPKNGRHWLHYGINFAVVISLVTFSVIYFQHRKLPHDKLVQILPLALVFALINSFVEESITRLGVVVCLKKHLPDAWIALISGGLFGLVHYWGNPGGLPGVLLAFFLGWFLAKSILETKGIFWAWVIHFLQDILIITALLSST